MKKILHIASYYPPHIGGVEQVAFDVISSLSQGFEHTVICFNDKKKTEIDSIDGVTVIRVATSIKIASQPINFRFKSILKKHIREFCPDFIHFHFPNPFVARYLLKCKCTAKLIVHWHSDIIKQKTLKKFFKGQTIKLLKTAERIIATSPQYIEFSEFLPKFKEKIVMIANCINEKTIDPDAVDSEIVAEYKAKYLGKIICFFAGRHVPYKGLEYLIQGLPYIEDNIHIIIAGHGPLTEKLKRMSADNCKMEFIGMLKREELKNHFAACDIFIFPSITKNEAFGLALAEAMYFGKPAVTFTIEGSGVNYVSLNGVTGIECPNKDSKAFAEAINRLASDDELRRKMGKNARNRVSEKFLFEMFEKNINDFYGVYVNEKENCH